MRQLVEQGLVLQVSTDTLPQLPADTLSAAADAVRVNGHVYAYPTLVCGNFLLGLNPPGSNATCQLGRAKASYDDYHQVMSECQAEILPGSPYKRVLGGKMNDAYGWYLPFLYIDGYIDAHELASVAWIVDRVMKGKINRAVCRKLNWHIDLCKDNETNKPNKCYDDFPGSYVQSSDNVYTDIDNQETAFFFGFSEKVAAIIERTIDPNVVPYAAISVPLGEANHLLQFTDALVVNKARWDAANEERRNAIKAFVNYFLEIDLRKKIALGKDLDPPQNRYLLQARENFYHMTDVAANPVYQDLYWSLKKAVAAPSLSDHEKERMLKVLSRKCIR